eukprot:TRINITY_DN65537_c0_g1_i1.p1 TRINITY_DN65537_c0_g1~~TRINITY_DN65537_c0_g1_i1.p1  ORF type:complete len:845 (+),score=269.62 TRINITY_DN65537_c0_g1_i1:98-2632(+)
MPRGDEELFSEDDEEAHFSPTRPAGAPPPAPSSMLGKFEDFLLSCMHSFSSFDTAAPLSVEQRQKMQQYQSLDYITRYSEVHKKHLAQPSMRFRAGIMKWVLFFIVGSSVGFLAFIMRQTIDLITSRRLEYVAALLGGSAKHFGLAWMFLVGTGIGLVLFASCIVVFLWPFGAGSGIEEVIAYLNGVDMPRVFNVRTMVVKILSCIGSVSSGLPCGPEGPLIHLGAICGAGLTQGRSTTFGCNTNLFRKFRNASDHRDFITAGAAAGISAAFGAPIGGLLFVMEEMSTHWKPSLTLMIFFTSLAAFSIVSLFNSAFEAWEPTGTFGSFLNRAAVLFEVTTIIQLNILAIFPAFLIGTLGGLLGALFTTLNVKANLWRRKYVFDKPWKRVLEPVVVIVIYSTVSLLLPLAFDCQNLVAAGDSSDGVGTTRGVTEDRSLLATFLCDDPNQYNPLGTLTVNGNEGTVRRLFSRGTDGQFGTGPLFVYFVLYFVGSCYTAGMSLSSGILIPMILMGATMGRLVGHLLVVTLVKESYVASNQWIDPGVFALIGSGAFVGGVTRLTVSLVVIMLEISAELHFLLPIMLAVITAGWVANFVTPSLYHCYLSMKNVPIMPLQIENHRIDMAQHTALDAVPGEPIVFKSTEQILKICETLKLVSHNCFPVLSQRGTFEGTILRSELELLLRSPEIFRKPGGEDPKPGESPVKLSHLQLQNKAEEAFFEKKMQINWLQRLSDTNLQCTVDMLPYVNRSPFTVQSDFSLDLTYDLFTTLGLRHLVVVRRDKCMGIITRKDLLESVLTERLGTGALSNYHASNRPEWTAQDQFLADAEDVQEAAESDAAGSSMTPP